jgi:hypothetical protein
VVVKALLIGMMMPRKNPLGMTDWDNWVCQIGQKLAMNFRRRQILAEMAAAHLVGGYKTTS